MSIPSFHSFHIPVMGLAFTIDTPVKVARFGITSVVSIGEDNLAEKMRQFYCAQEQEEYIPIHKNDIDSRARRTTAYLNLLQRIVVRQMKTLVSEEFREGNDIVKYFRLLPPTSSIRVLYDTMNAMEEGNEKTSLQDVLRKTIRAGSIDVNIMTKCDKINFSAGGEQLPAEHSDAMAALRGFASSELSSSVVFSAGMNPRLYSYCETFSDFYSNETGNMKKKITLKVSDYRSALIQGKFLAKKGLWVSEYRIESGLNCGGHAFATDGYLMGPILEEFKLKKKEHGEELFEIYKNALQQKGRSVTAEQPGVRISVQGGIGTANENLFLLEQYPIDSTGWGSPFLLVPEATNVDDETLLQLATAKKDDFYLSYASPLGVPFNNFRKSSGEKERLKGIEDGRPGSACYNKYLSFNTEFTEKPICIASREYQKLKIQQLTDAQPHPDVLTEQIANVTVKECICQGLGTAAYMKHDIPTPHKLTAISICPGPNLAYFSGVFSLTEMIDHIYGRISILNDLHRPNMFINELKLYVEYLEREISKSVSVVTARQQKYLNTFKENLLSGIDYYKGLAVSMIRETELYRHQFDEALKTWEEYLHNLHVPEPLGVN